MDQGQKNKVDRGQKNKPAGRGDQEKTPVEPKNKAAEGQKIIDKADEVGAKIDKAIEEATTDKDAMDTLIDEIDAVLEVNAEEFVKNYVQRGGE